MYVEEHPVAHLSGDEPGVGFPGAIPFATVVACLDVALEEPA
jgi:hypothetical protein